MFPINNFPYKAALFISFVLVAIIAIPMLIVLYASVINEPSSWSYSFSNGISLTVMKAPFNPEYTPEIAGHLIAKMIMPILALISVMLRRKIFFRIVSILLVLSGFASGGIPFGGIVLLGIAFSSSIASTFSSYHQAKKAEA